MSPCDEPIRCRKATVMTSCWHEVLWIHIVVVEWISDGHHISVNALIYPVKHGVCELSWSMLDLFIYFFWMLHFVVFGNFIRFTDSKFLTRTPVRTSLWVQQKLLCKIRLHLLKWKCSRQNRKLKSCEKAFTRLQWVKVHGLNWGGLKNYDSIEPLLTAVT